MEQNVGSDEGGGCGPVFVLLLSFRPLADLNQALPRDDYVPFPPLSSGDGDNLP